MHKDWLFQAEGYVCGLRAAGVLVSEGRVLLQREKGRHIYAVPGGHVRLGETTEESLVREYAEETGMRIRCVRLLWTEECFWSYGGLSRHLLTFYYLIEVCPGEEIPAMDAFTTQRDQADVEYGWKPIDELAGLEVYPAFLSERIGYLDGPAMHFVTRA